MLITLLVGYVDFYYRDIRDLLLPPTPEPYLGMTAPLSALDPSTIPPLDIKMPFYLRLILPGTRHFVDSVPLVVNTDLSENELFARDFANPASLYNWKYIYEAYGVPFRSLGFMNKNNLSVYNWDHFTPEPRWYYQGIPTEPKNKVTGRKTLPVMIYPIGFIASSISYALLIFAISRSWMTVRGWRRWKGGRCVGCDYPLESLKQCPECGALRT